MMPCMNAASCHFFRRLNGALLLLTLLVLGGCNASYNVKNLAKTDIDMVADLYVEELYNYNHDLMVKLYKRNPRELEKKTGISIDTRTKQLGRYRENFRFKELDNKVGPDALNLVFDESFQGDRVFALMVGIRSMLHAAYGHNREFFLLDELNQQQLYNSARNLEILAWRLKSYKDSNGRLFLLTNGYQDKIANLSYERLFGKMISLQDMMAKIVAGKTNRTINTVVHGFASSTFLPIGI